MKKLWRRIRNKARWLWSRRTTAFGYVQVTLGVLVVSGAGIIPENWLKGIVLASGLLTAWLGHYNHRKAKPDPQSLARDHDGTDGAD